MMTPIGDCIVAVPTAAATGVLVVERVLVGSTYDLYGPAHGMRIRIVRCEMGLN
jgi:hypothetical protein